MFPSRLLSNCHSPASGRMPESRTSTLQLGQRAKEFPQRAGVGSFEKIVWRAWCSSVLSVEFSMCITGYDGKLQVGHGGHTSRNILRMSATDEVCYKSLYLGEVHRYVERYA